MIANRIENSRNIIPSGSRQFEQNQHDHEDVDYV